MKKTGAQYLVMSLLMFSTFWLMMPRGGHSWDTFCWTEWAAVIYKEGLQRAYHSFTDYVPVMQYILGFFAWAQGIEDDLRANINYLKVVTLVFHFLTGYFVLRFLVRYAPAGDNHLLNVLFYLCNIGILYNAVIWNQVDIILACFVFISIWYAIHEKVTPALLMLLLGLNFKIHAMIFIPIIGLLLLPVMIRTFTLLRLLVWTGSLLLLQFIIILPFLIDGTAHRIIEVIRDSFDKYPFISAYAYNVWYFFVEGNLFRTHDFNHFGPLTYKQWGLLMFFTSSFFALWPLLRSTLMAILHRSHPALGISRLLIMCSLVPLLFFYFNTQMHERYSHPALVFTVTYAIIARRPFPAVFACLACALNLEDELQYFGFNSYHTVIFDPIFISGLYLLSIILLYVDLYSKKIAAEDRVVVIS